ncbi:DNA-3-methyladenine glycosylase III [Persephonella hydrogeniphila]|uniref:DNA-3-methyladenine glycosylase III n=1 Tax=Persephonella hydrogeniphila TaxID=198703 RepID=A0A285NPR6_9AQUI|nr:endonuclease [Persephonella hydrogeniphila]SNZ09621.1 DNA-3-methyladenine glycosylase III [Persephonella hydrogeniphila]
MEIKDIYFKLLEYFGYQNWWPVHKGIDPFLEVSVGAILTQNTNWRNVEKAINNLLCNNLLCWDELERVDLELLKECIKPAGFYNQKALYIKNFVKRFKDFPKDKIDRDTLLSVKGIGEETADSILLYGLDRPYFVIDAYTKRLFYRTGLINKKEISYRELQSIIEANIPVDVNLYKEFHALIVEHGKVFCRKKPVCDKCPFYSMCEKNLK